VLLGGVRLEVCEVVEEAQGLARVKSCAGLLLEDVVHVQTTTSGEMYKPSAISLH